MIFHHYNIKLLYLFVYEENVAQYYQKIIKNILAKNQLNLGTKLQINCNGRFITKHQKVRQYFNNFSEKMSPQNLSVITISLFQMSNDSILAQVYFLKNYKSQHIQSKMHKSLSDIQLKKGIISMPSRSMYTSEQKYKQSTKSKKHLITQKLQLLSPQEKQEWVYFKKLHANQYYKAQKFDKAIETYFEALLGLDVEQTNQQKLQQINTEYKYPLMLNIVTCLFKKKQFRRSVELCNEIISQKWGKKHIKAHFKQASCLIAMGQYQQAKEVIGRGIKFVGEQKQLNTRKKDITRKDFQQLLEELKAKIKNQDDMYQRIFTEKQDETEKLTESDSVKQESVLVYQETYRQQLAKCCEGTYRWIKSCFFDERWEKYN